MLPAVYYLSARFKDDFEAGVLHALNGGGQNQVRTMLTGALIGAQVGFSKIPERFIDGLKQKKELLELVDRLVENFK
jgi:ADP-ribosylglycohydrolase